MFLYVPYIASVTSPPYKFWHGVCLYEPGWLTRRWPSWLLLIVLFPASLPVLLGLYPSDGPRILLCDTGGYSLPCNTVIWAFRFGCKSVSPSLCEILCNQLVLCGHSSLKIIKTPCQLLRRDLIIILINRLIETFQQQYPGWSPSSSLACLSAPLNPTLVIGGRWSLTCLTTCKTQVFCI